MMTVLRDTTKFTKLRPIETYDDTLSTEAKFQKKLVKWVKSDLLPSTISDLNRPVGSICPHLYGLPKTHKDGIPLKPILSMIATLCWEEPKWLDTILQPVLGYYSIYNNKDFFDFSNFIQEYSLTDKFMCFFDICSLFTCVLLLERGFLVV